MPRKIFLSNSSTKTNEAVKLLEQKTLNNEKMINKNFQSTRGTDNSSKKLIDNK